MIHETLLLVLIRFYKFFPIIMFSRLSFNKNYLKNSLQMLQYYLFEIVEASVKIF